MLPPFRGHMPLLVAIVIVFPPGCGRGTPRTPTPVVDSEPLPPEADLSPAEAAKVLMARPRMKPQR
jgi:hypothetical protein